MGQAAVARKRKETVEEPKQERRQHVLDDTTHGVEISAMNITDYLSRGDVEETLRLILENGLDPKSQQARQMQAMIRLRQRKWDEARSMIEENIRRDPTDALSIKMMGDLCFLTSKYDDAVNCYTRSYARAPDKVDTLHDKAVAMAQGGHVEEALPIFEEACMKSPGRADYVHHLAIMQVLAGHEVQGWANMEARMDIPGICGGFPRPEAYWKGEPLEGKTLVIRSEQGFGDTIMFMRYVRKIVEMKPKKIYCYCQPEMLDFIGHFYRGVEVWNHKMPPPQDFDYHINLMSLPKIFPGEYLKVPANPKPRGRGIAVCWFGSPTHKADHLRTIGFEHFMKLMENYPNEEWLCAAYGFFDNKPPYISYFVERCQNWFETAVQFEKRVRLLITCDTAIAHLAGFLGIPCWLLLPKIPDFRWGLEGEQKWYESVKLYRQKEMFNWDEVFERLKADLEALQ